MRRLQLIAHGEPLDVIKLNTVDEPALGQEMRQRSKLIIAAFATERFLNFLIKGRK